VPIAVNRYARTRDAHLHLFPWPRFCVVAKRGRRSVPVNSSFNRAFMQPTVARYLSIARNALGMDMAWLSEHTGGEQVLRAVSGESGPFGVAEGDALSWEGSFCMRVLAGTLPGGIPDTGANPITAALPVTEQLGIGSYVGTPVRLPDGKVFGMLCCISRGRHGDFREHQMRLLESLAASLGEELADEAGHRGAPGSVLHRVSRAIEGEGLSVVVQPIVELATMRSAGAEALTRFSVPPARPDVWFAEATELGLGEMLEMAAIRKALALLDGLPDDVYLSINTSPAVVHSRELLDALSGVDARRIVVEVTEHSSVADYDALLASLDALRRRGVRIAVDDAGAGYASFRHILALQPDIIKCDREMVTGLDADPVRAALVGALVAFAAEIGATLVAEGVETAGELTALARLGVSSGQGYHLARPGPLPLPEISARPASLRRDPAPETGEPELPLEESVCAVLREVVARTRLEASYLSVWDAERETLEQRIVHDPRRIGIRTGLRVPWRETPCFRCRTAGIVWTADVHADLPGALPPDTPVRTFMSVPVLDARGDLAGTLCGVSRERLYLSDPVLDQVERLGREVAELMRRAG
jgi:EAL domain-containing protein (putative c-di-GMP-specific phosphodiesterase class I)